MGRARNLLAAGFVALMMALPLSATGTDPAPGDGGRATASEGQDDDAQNNDDFPAAQEFAGGDFLDGTTGLDDPHRIDTYVLRDVPAGKVINASCLITNFDQRPGQGQCLQLTGWNRHHADALAWSNREDNPDRRPWEALSFLCVVSGDYYIQLKPIAGEGTIEYLLHIQDFDPEDITAKIGTGGAFGATISGQVSSLKWYPGHWYRFTMTGEQNGMNDYLYVNMTEPGAPDQRLWGDIYVRNLEAESYSYWLNHSWWLDSYVQYEEVHAAACGPGPRTYYLDIQAYDTSGPRSENYELRITRTLFDSDGDNHPLNATPVSFSNGKTTVRRTGSVERGPDMFDWYKLHLDKGEGVSASLGLLERSWAIFRLSIWQDNLTGGLDLLSSWTNKPFDTVLNRINALAANVSQEGWYYICVIAQMGLMPANLSNLCDWTVQTARAIYQLDITTCPPSYPPYVKNEPAPVVILEDGSDSTLELNFTGHNNGVFADDDFGEGWGEALLFGCEPNPHLAMVVDGTDPAAPATISPSKDWNGETELLLTATDLYGKSCSTTVHVFVTGVNDPPFVKARIPDFTVFSGAANNTMKDLDLLLAFGDPDFPPLGGDTLTFSVDESQFPANITDGKLTFGQAPWFRGKGDHIQVVTVNATDKAGLTASMQVNITVIGRCRWPVTNEYWCKMAFLEDEVSYYDLNRMFMDPDGDPLSFSYIGGASDNLTVEIAPNGSAVFRPFHDYFTAQEIIRFRARDTQGLSCGGELIVSIQNVNDAPYLLAGGMGPDPLDGITIDENLPVTFRVFAADVDNKTSELRYTWFIDEFEKIRMGASSFSWRPDFEDAGTHVVKVRVSDGLTYIDAEWNVSVNNVNRVPVVNDLWPVNNTVFASSDRIRFRACATDPDGDPVRFFWRLSDGTLLWTESGKNASAFSKRLGPGLHVIVLDVEDGQGGVARHYIYTYVRHTDDQPPGLPWAWIGGAAAAVILLASTASLWGRKGR